MESAKGKYRVATTDKLLCPARRKYKYTTTWSPVNNSALNTIININPLAGGGGGRGERHSLRLRGNLNMAGLELIRLLPFNEDDF